VQVLQRNDGTDSPLMSISITEQQTRILAENRATGDALPGPLKMAFGRMEISVGVHMVRPVVAYDFAIWEAMNSPIHRQMLEIMQFVPVEGHPEIKPDEVSFTRFESFELIWQLTRKCEDVDRVYQKGGIGAISTAARLEIGQLDLPVISQLLEAAVLQVKRQLETTVGYAQQEEDGKTTFFPEAGANPTASAGG
jgi:hypothetical protein